MDAAAELGRNPVSKHQIQPEYGDEHQIQPVSKHQIQLWIRTIVSTVWSAASISESELLLQAT